MGLTSLGSRFASQSNRKNGKNVNFCAEMMEWHLVNLFYLSVMKNAWLSEVRFSFDFCLLIKLNSPFLQTGPPEHKYELVGTRVFGGRTLALKLDKNGFFSLKLIFRFAKKHLHLLHKHRNLKIGSAAKSIPKNWQTLAELQS